MRHVTYTCDICNNDYEKVTYTAFDTGIGLTINLIKPQYEDICDTCTGALMETVEQLKPKPKQLTA